MERTHSEFFASLEYVMNKFIFAALFTQSLLLAVFSFVLGAEYHWGDGVGLIGYIAFPISLTALTFAGHALNEYVLALK